MSVLDKIPECKPEEIGECLYSVLGINKGASREEILKAYRRMSKKYHPDRNPGDDHAKVMYEKVDLAYRVLTDPVKRSTYDTTGKYDKTSEGMRQAQINKTISDVLLSVVKQVLQQDGDITREPILEHMDDVLVDSIDKLKEALGSMKQVLKSLMDTLPRFSSEEGESTVIEDSIKMHVEKIEVQLKLGENDLATMRATRAYLKRYRYKIESVPTAQWSMFPTNSSWTVVTFPPKRAKP